LFISLVVIDYLFIRFMIVSIQLLAAKRNQPLLINQRCQSDNGTVLNIYHLLITQYGLCC